MSLKSVLTDMAANVLAGFVGELADAARHDAARIHSHSGLKDAGADIAAAFLGQPRTIPTVDHYRPVFDDTHERVLRPTVIEVEAIRRNP